MAEMRLLNKGSTGRSVAEVNLDNDRGREGGPRHIKGKVGKIAGHERHRKGEDSGSARRSMCTVEVSKKRGADPRGVNYWSGRGSSANYGREDQEDD
jgi:hypothetical protein